MHINAIELFHVALPSRKPMATPLGPRDVLETVIAAVHGEGAVGWDEAAPGIGVEPDRAKLEKFQINYCKV